MYAETLDFHNHILLAVIDPDSAFFFLKILLESCEISHHLAKIY